MNSLAPMATWSTSLTVGSIVHTRYYKVYGAIIAVSTRKRSSTGKINIFRRSKDLPYPALPLRGLSRPMTDVEI